MDEDIDDYEYDSYDPKPTVIAQKPTPVQVTKPPVKNEPQDIYDFNDEDNDMDLPEDDYEEEDTKQ